MPGVDIYDIGPALTVRMVALARDPQRACPRRVPAPACGRAPRCGRRARPRPALLRRPPATEDRAGARRDPARDARGRGRHGRDRRAARAVGAGRRRAASWTASRSRASCSAQPRWRCSAAHGLPRRRPDRRAAGRRRRTATTRARGRVANDDHLVCDLFPYDVESALLLRHDPDVRGRHARPGDRDVARAHAGGARARPRARSRRRQRRRRSTAPSADFYEGLGYPTSLSKPEGTVLRDGLQPRPRPRRRARRPRGAEPRQGRATSSSPAT